MFPPLLKLIPKKGRRLLCRLCVNSAHVYSEYFTDYFFKVQREIDMRVAPSLSLCKTNSTRPTSLAADKRTTTKASSKSPLTSTGYEFTTIVTPMKKRNSSKRTKC
jgi:hypothetical protein